MSDRWHHCGKKVSYSTQERAEVALAELDARGKLDAYVTEVYRCRYRDEWHVGRDRRRLDCRRVMLPIYVDHPHAWYAAISAYEAHDELSTVFACHPCQGWHRVPVTSDVGKHHIEIRIRRAARRARVTMRDYEPSSALHNGSRDSGTRHAGCHSAMGVPRLPHPLSDA